MFHNAASFNGAIGDWPVANVKSMQSMFEGASVFNEALSNWPVWGCDNFYAMFKNAKEFNQDLKLWNFKSNKDKANLSEMFMGAKKFNQNLCDWASRIGLSQWTTNMFKDTACPETTADPGHWEGDELKEYGSLCSKCGRVSILPTSRQILNAINSNSSIHHLV